VFQSRS
jgi:N-glycosylase/DNA lyase